MAIRGLLHLLGDLIGFPTEVLYAMTEKRIDAGR